MGKRKRKKKAIFPKSMSPPKTDFLRRLSKFTTRQKVAFVIALICAVVNSSGVPTMLGTHICIITLGIALTIFVLDSKWSRGHNWKKRAITGIVTIFILGIVLYKWDRWIMTERIKLIASMTPSPPPSIQATPEEIARLSGLKACSSGGVTIKGGKFSNNGVGILTLGQGACINADGTVFENNGIGVVSAPQAKDPDKFLQDLIDNAAKNRKNKQ